MPESSGEFALNPNSLGMENALVDPSVRVLAKIQEVRMERARVREGKALRDEEMQKTLSHATSAREWHENREKREKEQQQVEEQELNQIENVLTESRLMQFMEDLTALRKSYGDQSAVVLFGKMRPEELTPDASGLKIARDLLTNTNTYFIEQRFNSEPAGEFVRSRGLRIITDHKGRPIEFYHSDGGNKWKKVDGKPGTTFFQYSKEAIKHAIPNTDNRSDKAGYLTGSVYSSLHEPGSIVRQKM